jgi:hypothetical protein
MDAMKDERCDCNEWRWDASEKAKKSEPKLQTRHLPEAAGRVGTPFFVSRRKCEG